MIFELLVTALMGSLVGVLGVSVVLFLCRTWISERLKQSISHEYALKLEEWKRAEQIRAKSETIAALFAEWMTFPEEQKALNQLTIEAYLWLPTDILQELTQVLNLAQNAPNAREVLSKVRQHLLNDNSLEAADIIIFEQENKRRAFEVKLKRANGLKAFRASSAIWAKGFQNRAESSSISTDSS